MKKITLKIAAFLLLTMFAFQMQAQIEDGKVYTLRNLSNGFYFSAIEDPVGEFEMLMELSDTSNAQRFEFVASTNNGNPAWNIVSPLRGEGRGTLRGAGSGILINSFTGAPTTSGDKTWTAILVPDAPVPNVYKFTIGAGSRQIEVDANNVPGFLEVGDSTAPIPVTAQWVLEESPFVVLSASDFDTSSIFVSNPVVNEIEISGFTSNLKEVSVYSLLGQKMLTKQVNSETSLTLDASALTSGMYLVKLQGDNGSFTQKIVKQ